MLVFYKGQEKINALLLTGDVAAAKKLAYEWVKTDYWNREMFFSFLDTLEDYFANPSLFEE
jgi:hypothetical protein